jgi:flagellar assembly protein FliH
MTSLSRIIRSANASKAKNEAVTIEIRNLFSKQFDEEEEVVEAEPQITLEEILREKERMIEEARVEIAAMKEAFERECSEKLSSIEQQKQLWEEEKLELQREAYEEGFQQGYEEGIQKANSDMEEAMKIANETIEHARENAKQHLEEQQYVILDLAIQSAEKIIGHSLEKDEELFLSIVKRGLKEARERKEIKLYVSSTYYPLVTGGREELAEIFPPDVPFLIFVNEDLNDTECYIETNHGRIVVSVDEQLKELRSKLIELLESWDA